MKINLNDRVRFKPTDLGREKLRQAHAEFWRSGRPGAPTPQYVEPVVDDDGYASSQLWSFMQDFGPHLSLGLRMPVEPEVIIVLSQHPDSDAIDEFAEVMKAKMARKRAEGKSGWDDREAFPLEALSAALRDHVDKGDPVDVANFAMMLFHRAERVLPADAPETDEQRLSRLEANCQRYGMVDAADLEWLLEKARG